jgi:hypothetical protein
VLWALSCVVHRVWCATFYFLTTVCVLCAMCCMLCGVCGVSCMCCFVYREIYSSGGCVYIVFADYLLLSVCLLHTVYCLLYILCTVYCMHIVCCVLY